LRAHGFDVLTDTATGFEEDRAVRGGHPAT
jgi:hypothetical protein